LSGGCSAAEEKKATTPAEEKKGKGRKRQKKDAKRPMAVKKEPGRAIIARLHLADNGIDGFHVSSTNNRQSLVQLLQLCTSSVTTPSFDPPPLPSSSFTSHDRRRQFRHPKPVPVANEITKK